MDVQERKACRATGICLQDNVPGDVGAHDRVAADIQGVQLVLVLFLC